MSLRIALHEIGLDFPEDSLQNAPVEFRTDSFRMLVCVKVKMQAEKKSLRFFIVFLS